MTKHISIRLAWHDDGWNGHICQHPERNVYCVGCKSYPGEVIRERRDLNWEKSVAGKPFNELERIPPCVYSANAFSGSECFAEDTPPDFYDGGADPVQWQLPASTACTWPYEAMYLRDGVKKGNTFDYEARFNFSCEHFDELEEGASLAFYYAHYSNPFSSEEHQRHVLVGVSLIGKIAPPVFYSNCTQEVKEKFHNGFVWQRGITSQWPEQGVRLPYHKYKDELDEARRFVVFPEQTHACKYGSRQLSDDDAIGLLEQLLNSLYVLKNEIKDKSDDWEARIDWVNQLLGRLWHSRGAYPGIPAVLEYLGLSQGISFYRKAALASESDAYNSVCDFISGKTNSLCDWIPSKDELKNIRRKIVVSLEGSEIRKKLLLEIMPRIALSSAQISRLISDQRSEWGVLASEQELVENPYLLAEQYKGDDDSDSIRWSLVDRGMVPAMEIEACRLVDLDAPERLRALLLETLRASTPHVFIKAENILDQVNVRLERLPEWKRIVFKRGFLEADKEFYKFAIHYREEQGELLLYDLDIFEDERLVDDTLTQLLKRPTVKLSRIRTKRNWQDALLVRESLLYTNEEIRPEYEKAISLQADACIEVFDKPFAVLAGSAGTGKSTVATAFLKGVQAVSGIGVSICILAPTGKAADRLRKELKKQGIEGVDVETIHALLTRHGWLSKNMNLKRAGGQKVTGYQCLVIDECSMIDNTLFASFCRAMDWNSVSRLMLVGDPAQLPPIGVGRVYADIISHVREAYPDQLVELSINLRQMHNRVEGKGTSILDVAELFRNSVAKVETESGSMKADKLDRDELLIRIQDGGEIGDDLSVIYWSEEQDLANTLIEKVHADFCLGEESAQKTWSRVLQDDIVKFQVLSPVRGEMYGTEALNLSCQKFKAGSWAQRGSVDGFHLFDKVIQVRNRTKSDPIYAWNHKDRSNDKVQIFNGEIGTIKPKPKQAKYLKWNKYSFSEFAGYFVEKDHLAIDYSKSGKNSLESNTELAYAISVHKSQGSEFEHVYFVIPKANNNRRMMELIYTGITRASMRCTLLIQDNVSSLIGHARPEKSALACINSSLFELNQVPDELLTLADWYESGKVHKSIMGLMLRSKSEVIVADLLFQNGLEPFYEKPLTGKDGSQYLPDFTIQYQGQIYYWEHLGLLDDPDYMAKWQRKERWYQENGYSDQLIVSRDVNGSIDSSEIDKLIKERIFGLVLSEITKSWDEISELTELDCIQNFVQEARSKGLQSPVWGYEIVIGDQVQGEVEFAWPESKVAITTDDDLEESLDLLEENDWSLFSIDQFSPKKLIKVLSALISKD
ncbi:AAA family ATPase [Vibrio sp. A1-1]|uniref:AAA family ATPase n=1 Tax=Vibrio sp. A1-1 TaxID=2912250 RepID=UPI001F18CDBC|nr:AAA family ATPase [Vibrio sp. A1-1]MCF7453016.1 AAA family ATPase [Vibrio sp. A1-1]